VATIELHCPSADDIVVFNRTWGIFSSLRFGNDWLSQTGAEWRQDKAIKVLKMLKMLTVLGREQDEQHTF